MSARVDGNVLAGWLSEVFVGDVTMAVVTCRRCDARSMVAEAVVDLDADCAIVLCRSCTHTLLRVWRSGVLELDGLAAWAPATAPEGPGTDSR